MGRELFTAGHHFVSMLDRGYACSEQVTPVAKILTRLQLNWRKLQNHCHSPGVSTCPFCDKEYKRWNEINRNWSGCIYIWMNTGARSKKCIFRDNQQCCIVREPQDYWILFGKNVYNYQPMNAWVMIMRGSAFLRNKVNFIGTIWCYWM